MVAAAIFHQETDDRSRHFGVCHTRGASTELSDEANRLESASAFRCAHGQSSNRPLPKSEGWITNFEPIPALTFDAQLAAVLVHDDGPREPIESPSPVPRPTAFVVEEWIEDFLPDFLGNAAAGVGDADGDVGRLRSHALRGNLASLGREFSPAILSPTACAAFTTRFKMTCPSSPGLNEHERQIFEVRLNVGDVTCIRPRADRSRWRR